MAGETISSEAVCLDIRPWSKTSHVVSWLTPRGKVVTVVRGAARSKSFFLGQYDLNYTCDIVYYARAKGEVHALRDCVPIERRDALRGDYCALALAGYFRRLAGEFAPTGADCEKWYELLVRGLDEAGMGGSDLRAAFPVAEQPDGFSISGLVEIMLRFELEVLRLSGLTPDFSGYDREAEWSPFSLDAGSFCGGQGRCIRVSREVAEYLRGSARSAKKSQIPLDAARVIGVFYQFHLDCAFDVRRTVLGMIAKN